MKLSIIVTTYNIEKYVATLLESLLNQVEQRHRRKIEIIITDDKSTDNTVLEIEKFFQANADVKHILNINSVNNKFPGKGLNFGLKHAKGKYLHFVDGDDYINSDIYNSLLDESLFSNEDLVEFSISFFYKNMQIFKTEYIEEEFTDSFPYDLSKRNFGEVIRSYSYCNKIYRADFIRNSNLKFVDDRSAQDMNFNIAVFDMQPVVRYCSDILLFYRCGIDSISTRINNKKLRDNITGAKLKIDYFPDSYFKEHMFLMGLLIHSSQDEILENMMLFEENDILPTVTEPLSPILGEWQNYLTYLALLNKDFETMRILISSADKLKKITNCNDRKLIGFMSTKELNMFLLLDLLLSFGDKYILHIETILNTHIFRKSVISLRKRKDMEYSYPAYIKLVSSVIKKMDDDLLLRQLKYEKVPFHLHSKRGFINFIGSYTTEKEIKYSVVMTHYNRSETAIAAIESFISNEYDCAELIIVDNKSMFSHLKKLERYIDNNNPKNVTLFKNKYNGYCGTRNKGIEIAKGEYISFLDDDDKITSDYFSTLDNYLVDNTIDVVRFNPIYVDDENNLIPKTYYNIKNKKHFFENLNNKDLFENWKSVRYAFGSSALNVINSRLLSEKSFIENIVYEDFLFYSEIIISMNNVLIIPDVIYIRTIHDGSIMSQAVNKEKMKFYFMSSQIIMGCLALNFSKYVTLTEEQKNYIAYLLKLKVEQLNIDLSSKEFLNSRDKIREFYPDDESISIFAEGSLDDEQINSISKKYR